MLPVPKNIYGVTKTAAEDLCRLFHRNHNLSCLILRTSRFFPEEDDNAATRETYAHQNAQANEYLCRRVDLEDAAAAHLCAVERASDIGFARYIVSATTPFEKVARWWKSLVGLAVFASVLATVCREVRLPSMGFAADAAYDNKNGFREFC